MKFILNKIEKMNKFACFMMRIGLFSVLVFCIILLSYIIKADSFSEYHLLKTAVPSLVMSVFIVAGGSFALDRLIKEHKQNK